MTLWIKKLYEEFALQAVYNGASSDFLYFAILHKQSLLNAGMVECPISGFLCDPIPNNLFYINYTNFVENKFHYTISREAYTRQCQINKIFVQEDVVKASLIVKGRQKTYLVAHSFAKEKLKTEWWYDKANRCYTNYLFDYPAYNPSYKGSPRFWRAPGDKEVYGHEFELKFATFEDKLDFAESIKETYKPCITEKDGSLDGGNNMGPSLELITPPWSYEESKQNFEVIFKLAHKYQVQPMNNGYAWHITVNLLNAANPQLAGHRLMQLFNEKSQREFWQQIARRASVSNINGRNYCKFEDKPTMNKKVWLPRWEARPVDHYYATFLRKCGTAIEIRLLKSTVDFSVFCSTLEIIRAAWNWAKGAGDFSSWESDLLCLSTETQQYITQQRTTVIEIEDVKKITAQPKMRIAPFPTYIPTDVDWASGSSLSHYERIRPSQWKKSAMKTPIDDGGYSTFFVATTQKE